jgi:hypothetical protein
MKAIQDRSSCPSNPLSKEITLSTRSMRRSLTRFLTPVVVAAAVTGGIATAAQASVTTQARPSTASASSVVCNVVGKEVRESDWDVNTGCYLQPGDTVHFGASGSIWSGVWFTGENGPQGWTNTANDSKFPKPSARAYSLLSRVDGSYQYVGTGENASFLYTGGGTYVYLRINDDRPGNGSGSFEVNVQVIR